MNGLLKALQDQQFRREVGNGLLDSLNRGAVASTFGAPVDLASGVVNSVLMGGGVLGHKLGLLRADQMPQPITMPVGGSEWLGQKMQNAGMVSENRNPVAEALASVAIPAAMSRGAKGLVRLVQSRMNLTPEQRAAQYPWEPSYFKQQTGVGIDDLIHRFDGGEAKSVGFTYPQEAALATAQRNAALPVEQGGLGLHPNNTPMERAKALGFDVETPLYHGTGADIKAFDPRMAGKNDSGLWGRGQYMTTSPDSANSYALREGDGANVMPVYGAIKNPMKVTTGSDFITRMPDGTNTKTLIGDNLDGSKIKKIAENAGHDGVVQIKPNGNVGDIVSFNPVNIRSRFAAFDPMRRHENDLLAGAVPFSLLLDPEVREKVKASPQSPLLSPGNTR